MSLLFYSHRVLQQPHLPREVLQGTHLDNDPARQPADPDRRWPERPESEGTGMESHLLLAPGDSFAPAAQHPTAVFPAGLEKWNAVGVGWLCSGCLQQPKRFPSEELLPFRGPGFTLKRWKYLSSRGTSCPAILAWPDQTHERIHLHGSLGM